MRGPTHSTATPFMAGTSMAHALCDEDSPLRILAFSVAINDEKNPLLKCWMRFISDMADRDVGCAYQLHVKTYHRSASLGRSAILIQKVDFVRKTLAEIPLGSRFIFSDLDVLPLMSLSALLHTADVTGTPAHMRDLVFMKETPGSRSGFLNTGVYIGRSTDATRKFFTSWQNAFHDTTDHHTMDQTVANRLLQRNGADGNSSRQMSVDSIRTDLSWSVFPQQVIAGTRRHIVWGVTVMYHAIFISPSEDKAAMLHQVWSDQGGRANSPRVVGWCDAPQSARINVAPRASPCPAPFTELAFRSIVGALLASNILPPGLIIDAGANDGSDACFYAEASPSRIVLAIEPLEQNVRVIERWAVGRPNLRAMQAGLGNRSSIVRPPPHLLSVAPGLMAQMSNFQGRRMLEREQPSTRTEDGSDGAAAHGGGSFTCTADRNFIGNCVRGQTCPQTAESLHVCKLRCLEEAACLAIVYNRYKHCFLKAQRLTYTPDTTEHKTVGCAKERAGSGEALGVSSSHGQASEVSFAVHRVDDLFLNGIDAPWRHERLGFAHFDLEGGELDVIRSARMTILRDLPVFTIEINVHRERRRTRELLAHVGALGYATYAVLENCGSPWADCRNVIAFPLDWLRRHAEGLRRADFSVGLGAAGSVLDLAWHSSKLVQVTADNVEQQAGYRACMPGNECCNGVVATHPRLGTCPCLIECVQQWWRTQPNHSIASYVPPEWNQRAAGQHSFFEQNFSTTLGNQRSPPVGRPNHHFGR